MYYVYILYSEKFDKYYIGHTDDLERRLTEHNETSENSFTSKYRPWKFVATYEISSERSIAIMVERIKKMSSLLLYKMKPTRTRFCRFHSAFSIKDYNLSALSAFLLFLFQHRKKRVLHLRLRFQVQNSHNYLKQYLLWFLQ